jgi:hypothetical protein
MPGGGRRTAPGAPNRRRWNQSQHEIKAWPHLHRFLDLVTESSNFLSELMKVRDSHGTLPDYSDSPFHIVIASGRRTVFSTVL